MLAKLIRRLESRTDYIRFLVIHEHNTIFFTCLDKDQWELTQHVLDVFKSYPIALGEFTPPYSYVQVFEKLPSTDVKGLLPMLPEQQNKVKDAIWIDSLGNVRRVFE